MTPTMNDGILHPKRIPAPPNCPSVTKIPLNAEEIKDFKFMKILVESNLLVQINLMITKKFERLPCE